MTWPAPVELHHDAARLVPLSHDHSDALARASADGDLSRLWYTSVPAPAEMPAAIDAFLSQHRAGTLTPFCVLGPDDVAVGMTTYCNSDATNRRVEIGHTWYAARVQRTALNTACKRMLLGHAFETLDCIAVEFCTHVLNTASRRAIERIGAQLDGIRRAHRILPNGTIRDTACYAIIASEWPTIRAHLDWKLGRSQ